MRRQAILSSSQVEWQRYYPQILCSGLSCKLVACGRRILLQFARRRPRLFPSRRKKNRSTIAFIVPTVLNGYGVSAASLCAGAAGITSAARTTTRLERSLSEAISKNLSEAISKKLIRDQEGGRRRQP